MEQGETESQAVVREVREELDLTIEPIKKDWTWHSHDGLLTLHWWRARAGGSIITPNPDEVADFSWMTQPQIMNTPGFLKSNIAYLEARSQS